jgi:hypothetical protein
MIPLFTISQAIQEEDCQDAQQEIKVYSLISAGSGKALDIYRNKKHNGVTVIQFPYKASSNLQFPLTDLNNGYWS